MTRTINLVPIDVADLRRGRLDPSGPRHAPQDELDHEAGVLLRLALWLAEVAAEAAFVATGPTASSMPGLAARHRRRAKEPPVAEPAL
jgi:hypothetical protein